LIKIFVEVIYTEYYTSMKDFFKILKRFIPPYKKQLTLNFLFNLLSALFTVFSMALMAPILEILFGMSEEVKEKLFNRFYSTKGSKGTGLGLVITRKVVEEHGGTIHVESKPGKGTTFTIEIPVQSAGQGDAIRAAV